MNNVRLTELEIKLMYLEDVVKKMHEVLCEQQGMIDDLQLLVRQCKDQLAGFSSQLTGPSSGERPPHY